MTDRATRPVARKYSKSSGFYWNSKQDFFSQNDALLEAARSQNRLYAGQPRRVRCKLCLANLPRSIDFQSHGVGYIFCSACSHLNGCFEDTRDFIERQYIADEGIEYSAGYIDAQFDKRTAEIYLPKIDFLIESIPGKLLRLLDVGCGSGYLVNAAHLRQVPAEGVDVGKTMVDFGNQQLSHLTGRAPLRHADEHGFYESMANSDANVISAIGVIEHLREPHQFFDAFRRSKASHLFYSVPMFSLSAILEHVFEKVFPRQLSGGHTHLFTETSIEKMNELIGADPVAEWRFGTDIMDLYRSLTVSLRGNGGSQQLIDRLAQGFASRIDDIQAVFDQNHFCSEIHCVVAKR